LFRTKNDVRNTCSTGTKPNYSADTTSNTEPFGEPLLFISNFTPVERSHYKCGVPLCGVWREIFNSDASIYGGQNRGNLGGVKALSEPHDNQPYTLDLYLPPLSTLILEHVSETKKETNVAR
jgi:1,4-alpha-glucan branching enzyme